MGVVGSRGGGVRKFWGLEGAKGDAIKLRQGDKAIEIGDGYENFCRKILSREVQNFVNFWRKKTLP